MEGASDGCASCDWPLITIGISRATTLVFSAESGNEAGLEIVLRGGVTMTGFGISSDDEGCLHCWIFVG